MLMFVWFWAATAAAFMPSSALMMLPLQRIETQHAAIETATRPILTLGWVDEDEAPIL